MQEWDIEALGLSYYVKAYNGVVIGDGQGGQSDAVSAPGVCKIEYLPLDPGYTSHPSFTHHDSNVIVVEWEEATGCGGTQDLDCHYEVTVTEHDNVKVVDVYATQYTLYRPIPGIKYCFEVTPCNRCGMGLPTKPICTFHDFCQTPIAVGQPEISH
jgi:hypothetical protein